ncbi:MAG: ResB protein required for cytochrome C biosynthesis, partial [Opitutaceae bacterium]
MNETLRPLRDFIVSLKLTVVLLTLGMVLVFLSTLDQVHLGIWGIQEKWYRSFIVMHDTGSSRFPVFPGGYAIGGLLLLNLIAAHIYRLKLTWKKAGIQLVHIGVILLLIGELLSGLWQEDYAMRLKQGQTKNYSESHRDNELAIIDTTDPKFDDVVAIPDEILATTQSIQNAKLPFRLVVKAFYPNAGIQMRDAAKSASVEATQGLGLT